MALASLPEHCRAGHRPGDDAGDATTAIVVRADSAGAVTGLIEGLATRNIEFSVYARVNNALSAAIAALGPSRHSDQLMGRGPLAYRDPPSSPPAPLRAYGHHQ